MLDKYQEQGQLLEPYLEIIISPLMDIVRSRAVELGTASNEITEVIQPICIIIYSLVTVCGYKSIIRFFPHQVSDLELAVSLLEKCHATNSDTSLRQESTGAMETKCVILLWLSILVLIPFDLSSVDTSMASSDYTGKDEPPPLVGRILEICKNYLSNAGPMRSIAGLLLSRLLTRPDMSKAFTSFIDWAHETLSSVEDSVIDHFRLLGVVEALAAIFKGRNKILGENISLNETRNFEQLNNPVDTNTCDTSQEMNCLEEEDLDVPDVLEDIIELLLSGLRDTDTVVRWSAAKGIGRVASRLTYSLADEILSSVLELFSPSEGDGSWHGGCLALGELARRGLLLPISFPKVVPVIIKALHYDIRRGPHSVGSHVRDAAAYVCWAFGRAYNHRDMKNVLEQVAPHLLTVACYDREVNCRRAAAAAFQENVGRQGNFSHGIDIVNTADYFALSSRANSYLSVAVFIAQYDGYLRPFVDELLHNKICHWEKGLRELASTALSLLVKFEPEYFANVILDKLVPCTLSSDLCMRHGATLATGEVVLALHKHSYALPTDKQKTVAGIVPAIEKARLYRGKGGEIMRSAVSRFIECISIAKISLTEKIKRSLLDTLNENLKHPSSNIQNVAVEALKHYIPTYFVMMENKGVNDIMSRYLEQLSDPNVAARRGSALALGVLPLELLSRGWKSVITKLCRSCKIEDNPDDRDAEARVNAVRGLVSVCETLSEAGEDGIALFPLIKNEVMGSLFIALEDYSTDNRGDIGSWVREAAMDGLERCTYILCNRDSLNKEKSSSLQLEKGDNSGDDHFSSYFEASLAKNLVGGIVKQAVEKMDKLRELAARILQRLLHNKTIFVPHIPHREILEHIVPNEAELLWGVQTFSYPRFVQLLKVSCYSKYVVSGLVISIGGLQESLRKASLSALLDYLQDKITEGHNKYKEPSLSLDILWILQKYRRCDRVIVPTLKTIEILFSRKLLLNMEDETPVFCVGVLDSLTVELRGTKDFSKLNAGIAILGYIASISDPISIRAFSHLLTFLAHRYPKIRKYAAEQVYLVLLENENLISADKLNEATETITETCWEGDVEEAKKRRLLLYKIANVETAATVNATKKESGKAVDQNQASADEIASYSLLVGSAGF
ncbi:hypothetical protein SASPL_102728 [Salvia splendens]|uniref:Tubulin-specific chaperone D n=1 Tax=Salvia splendens TaxID=180675 RepID=A0A8X8YRT6_SALSN|nr:hypothetical protein SASPL_102728 [Salvia splendens]